MEKLSSEKKKKDKLYMWLAQENTNAPNLSMKNKHILKPTLKEKALVS